MSDDGVKMAPYTAIRVGITQLPIKPIVIEDMIINSKYYDVELDMFKCSGRYVRLTRSERIKQDRMLKLCMAVEYGWTTISK